MSNVFCLSWCKVDLSRSSVSVCCVMCIFLSGRRVFVCMINVTTLTQNGKLYGPFV